MFFFNIFSYLLDFISLFPKAEYSFFQAVSHIFSLKGKINLSTAGDFYESDYAHDFVCVCAFFPFSYILSKENCVYLDRRMDSESLLS